MNKIQMINNHSPCRFCQQRHFRCHSTCQEYQEYSKVNQNIAERRHKKCDINDAIRGLSNRYKV